MAKKKTPAKRAAKKKPADAYAKRLNPADYGIDLEAIVADIREHLDHLTYAEVGERAGLKPGVVSHIFNGHRKPSLGAAAALAKASGGRLVVKYEPPRKKA